MIEFSKMKDVDTNNLLNFLRDHKLLEDNIERFFPHIFLVKEQDSIYGFGIMELKSGKAIIHNMYIAPTNRRLSLGDGLLRTMLNFAGTFNIIDALYLDNNPLIKSFLLKEGFQEVRDKNHNRKLVLNIEIFFNKPCKNIF